MSSNSRIIDIRHLWVEYDGTPILEDIDLTINGNELLGVIGPNGGGKTTLLKVMLGLIPPSHGRVEILGKPPKKSRKAIGYIPQYSHFDLNFPVSVWQVVLMGRYGRVGLFRRYRKADFEQARRALETVDMLYERDRQMGELSGGQQQRVFIARALVSEPRLLLLDEPTASIDPATRAEFYELLEKLKQNMTIIMVSHDVGAISIYVDEIACLNRKLYYHGSKEITPEVLEATYRCPVELIAHGHIPHRVLKDHHDA